MKLLVFALCMLTAEMSSAAGKNGASKKTAVKKKPAAPKPAKPIFKTAPVPEPESEPEPAAPPDPVPEPIAELLPLPLPPPLSAPWDMYGGGTPDKGRSVLQIEAGFTALPALAYHYSASDHFTIGLRASFDYGFYQLNQVFSPNAFAQMPLRIALVRGRFSLGLRLEPGAGISFVNLYSGADQIARYTVVSLLLPVSLGAMYHAGGVAIGGGVDVPFVIAVPTTGTAISEEILALGGLLFEASVSEHARFTLDAKVGALIPIGGDVSLIFRAVAGLAFKI